jgi:hypothetical protein
VVDGVWRDVQMDVAAARAAQQALLDAARELELLTTARGTLATEAGAGWIGPHRERFDAQLSRLLDRSVHLAAALRQTREAIGWELTAAAAEQARREAARAELRRAAVAAVGPS